ncbi:MAG: hypothetical protein GF333_04870 [Candidatus Omnitrophica bacterium]|nr:hypothetical protein [Candidatus Omnitrophota bacterium]
MKKTSEDIRPVINQTICAEYVTYNCSRHLAAVLKNGKTKKLFRGMAEQAKFRAETLREILQARKGKIDVSVPECELCRLNPEQFSVQGAVNIGLEMNRIAVSFYKMLASSRAAPEYKGVFARLLKEKRAERRNLKQEKKFESQKERFEVLDQHCVPAVFSKLKDSL